MSLLFIPDGTLAFKARIPGETRVPGPHEFGTRFPGAPEVGGFSADVDTEPVVAGLPGGVAVPANVLEFVAIAKELDAWITLGRVTQAWAADQGVADADWVDEDDRLALPTELSGRTIPSSVQAFLGSAARIEEILTNALRPR